MAFSQAKLFLDPQYLCFRIGSSEEYSLYKTEFKNHGKLLTEASINGRAISTFLLNTPFQTNHHQVPLLELPASKSGTNYETGLIKIMIIFLRSQATGFKKCKIWMINPAMIKMDKKVKSNKTMIFKFAPFE